MSPQALRFLVCLRRGTFCQQRQKVPKERRQNPWFWNPLRAWNAFYVENLLPRAPGALVYRLAFASSLRRHSLAAHAGPRWPGAAGMAAAPTGRRDVGIAPCANFGGIYARRGRCLHRPASPHDRLIRRGGAEPRPYAQHEALASGGQGRPPLQDVRIPTSLRSSE